MLRVAIAEDDFRVADIHEKFLQKISKVKLVGKVQNGRETIKLVKSRQIDLILLDIYMPDMMGTELIDKIKKYNPSVGIIMISAANEKPIIEATIQQGVFDYIIKPVKIERFIAAIERFKNAKSQLEESQVIEQTFLDQYFGYVDSKQKLGQKETPKGIDPLTLEKVKMIINKCNKGMTAEEIGERMGASRTTARRYLEYLISIEEGKAELEYGDVGRPERKYYLYKN
ncbi:response regulator [Robertmurraya massiliosenegalensis]|uniref:response regulator n=1 Tax=Robertmurraya massiliosenegalensis TaxID=1287657 RepID=UPI00031BEABE|nr:response regulator [Robertmurraya massiliosenegalensis]